MNKTEYGALVELYLQGEINPYPANGELIIMPANNGLADGMFLWPRIPDTII